MAVVDVPKELCADDVWKLLNVQGSITALSHEKRQELVEKVKVVQNNAVRRALALMMGDLYDRDMDSLDRDIAKIVLLDSNEDIRAEPSERVRLLRILWWIIYVYFDGDSVLAVEMSRELHPMER